MKTTNERLQECLSSLVEQMSQETPDLRRILDQAKKENWSDSQTMMEMMKRIQQDPDLESRFMQVFQEAFAPLRTNIPKIQQQEVPEGLFQGEKRWRLEPLFEAALIERIQYDGDIPEHRTAPLPPGTDPAVPIDTGARDPAVLGKMLGNASRSLRKKIEQHEKQRLEAIEAVAKGQIDDKALQRMQDHGEIIQRDKEGNVCLDVLRRGSKETDHPDYRRGEIPKPVKVCRLRATTTARMTEEDRRKEAWKFLSTTQGRRSVVSTIRGLVADYLRADGVEVTEREYDSTKRQEPIACHEWKVNLSGRGSVQPAFSLVDMASKVLQKGLLKELGSQRPSPLFLEVVSIDSLDTRDVGWAARLIGPSVGLIE